MLIISAEEYFENQELLLLYRDNMGQPTPIFHKHDYYEFNIMLSGKMVCHFEDGVCELSAGDIFLLRPNEVHWKEMSEDGRQYNVSFLASLMQSAIDYLMDGRECPLLIGSGHLPPCTLSSQEFQHIKQSLSLLAEDYVTSADTTRLRTRSLLIDILSAYLVRNSQSSSGSDMPAWLSRYLDEFHYHENLSKGVAYFKDVPVSHGHLCRLFKKHLNMSITQFVNDARLSYAAKMLVQSDTPILEINDAIGFSSLSHFYKLFRTKYGVTPNEYRTLGADRRTKLFRTYVEEP